MKKETKMYYTWNKKHGIKVGSDGKLLCASGAGLKDHEMQYIGVGLPYVCQAVRQSLLLGDGKDVMFGIKSVKHSYDDWTGDIFSDYEIEILKGTMEDVSRIFFQCVVGCSDCYGCGDW